MKSAALRELLNVERRKIEVDPREYYHEYGIRSFGKGIFHKEEKSGQELGEKRIFWVKPGDLVFSNVFAWEGAVAIASKAELGRVGSHRFITCTSKSTDGAAKLEYLRHYLLSGRGQKALQEASPGSAGRNRTLSIKSLLGIEVPLLGQAEELAVVSALNRIEANCAAFDLHLRAQLTSLREMAERVIADASLNAKPYRVCDIASLADDYIDVFPDRQYANIGLRNRGRGIFRKEPVRGEDSSYARLYKVDDGQLVYSKLFAWEGAVAVVREEFSGSYVSSEFPRFDLDTDVVDPAYVSVLIRGDSFQSNLKSLGTGMGQRRQRVSVDRFLNVNLMIPDRQVQREVVEILSKRDQIEAILSVNKRINDNVLQASRNHYLSRY